MLATFIEGTVTFPHHMTGAGFAAGGKTGGFSADGGVETKLKILTIEKARTSAEPSLFGDLPLQARRR